MSLSSLSVRRGVTFLMIFIVVFGFGLFSLFRLRLDLYPDIDFPLVAVVTQYEGAGPAEVEDLVTRPIEGAVSSVEGVKKVKSTSKQGVSLVNVEFDWGSDLNQAEIDVRKYIDLIRELLPHEATEPIVFALNPSMQPIAFMSINGPYPQTKLREMAEESIKPLLERVAGVAVADVIGGGKREIQVRLDPRRLAAAGVSPQQVVGAIRADNVQLPGGTIDQGGWEFTIQAKGRFTSLAQVEQVVVGFKQGVPTRLRDVAEVADSLKEETRIVRNNGRSGILAMVRKQSDANTVQAVNNVKAALVGIEKKAGRGVTVDFLFDQGEFIQKSIGNLGNTALFAILLAFLVLLFFLRDLRPSLIVALSIPLSVMATFFIMDLGGLTLNIISMSGLALAIGMLVDNSIVVQESIFLRAESGDAPRVAAVEGSKEVNNAIIASTTTTLVVFLPILFVPGIAGEMFRDMTITVCVSLLVSLLVALTAVPLAASRMLQSRTAGAAPRHGLIFRALGRIHERLVQVYSPALSWCLRKRKTTLVMVTIVFASVMALVPTIPRQFFPKQDNGLIVMQMKVQVGSSLEETDRAFQRMEQIVLAHVPERKTMNMDIGTGEGFVALFSEGAHAGIMRLKLVDADKRSRSQQQIEDDLRARFSRIPGVTAAVFHPNFLGSGGDIVVEIYGHDLDEARDVGNALKHQIVAVKGTADVTFSLEAGKPEFEVIYDRSRLAALGLNAAQVSSSISTVFGGSLASIYQEGGFEYDIRVRGPKSFRKDEGTLRNLPIVTPGGTSVPLSSLAEIRPAVGPMGITRQDQQRMATIGVTVPGKDLAGVTAQIKKLLDTYPWPEGFTSEIGGQAKDMQESFRWLGLALVFAIGLVYMVMASQFESFLHPFVILFTIPLAFIGAVLMLVLTGTPISVTALIGMLILGGIVVNNAIVLIDYINQLRAREMPLLEAVLEAGKRRMRPILMTAGTTALSMLPLALEIGEGAEGWSPMARVVIGGLIASTFLTLLVIPVFYTSLEAYRERRRERKAARRLAALEQQTSTP